MLQDVKGFLEPMEARIPAKCHRVKVPGLYAVLAETEGNGLGGKTVVKFISRETFFLTGGEDPAVSKKGRRGIMLSKAINPENVHFVSFHETRPRNGTLP
jgi:hypothetical protein